MRDWNKEIEKCKEDLTKAQESTKELSSSLVIYIDEKVKSGLLAPFLSEEIELKGYTVEDFGEDLAFVIHEWSANRIGMHKKYFLVLTGDKKYHLPSHLELLGKTEISEKIVKAVTNKFSGEALENMVKEFQKKWSKAD
ncbi:hypothetical protein MUP35_03255 [Patescibacteria group bacterium]|nr:hypothetical protein [Patescibacteria group bacterium]